MSLEKNEHEIKDEMDVLMSSDMAQEEQPLCRRRESLISIFSIKLLMYTDLNL